MFSGIFERLWRLSSHPRETVSVKVTVIDTTYRPEPRPEVRPAPKLP